MNKKLLSSALLGFAAAASLALAPVAAIAADPAKPAATKSATKSVTKKPAATSKTAAKKPAAAPETAPVDDMPEAVREQMSALIQQGVQLAAAPLQAGDDFLPYGVMQLKDGSLKQVQWKKPNPPPPQEVLRGIFLTMMQEAARNQDVIAIVTVAPTMVSGTTDDGKAVQVHMVRAEADHRDGAPRLALLPYTRENGKIEFGTTIYRVGNNPLFDHSKGANTVTTVPADAAKPVTAAPAAEVAKP